MCAKDDLIRRKGELAIAESVTAKDSNYVDTFGLDFAFSPLMARGNVSNANILSLIAFIISHRLFADKLNIQQSLPDRATVVPIIISRLIPSTLLAGFIPTTKIRDPLLKKNAAKSRILLACADGRIRQYYLTICAILANYEEQVLLTSVKKNRYCTRCTRCLDKGHDDFVHLVNCFRWKHYNFNIHVSLATDTLHLLLKGLDNSTTLVTQESSSTQLNERFRQVMHSTSLKRFNNKRAFTEAIIQQLIAVVSLLFILKAPFALHFIRAVCDLVILAQYKRALERMNVFKEEFRVYYICTRANSEAHYITIVKQFYSMINKKETALLAADHATVVKQSRLSTTIDIQDRTYSTRLIPGIQPHSTKLPLSEVAANIAISDFIHAAAQSSSKRHNDPKHCNEERRDYVWVQEFKHRDNRRQSRIVTDNRKHMAYIRAFSEVLLFNNNRQINNTTRMLSVPFKFYDLSTIICSVHLVPRDLPNLTTRTTMSYYVNNYID
ncbi:hypothetical protein HBI48_249360 [Parastagonospora nodorum]|nr:hypothetical protein HBI48_249360 [Parastagonospora nodorum]